MDGKIVIGTDIDTSGVEEGLISLRKLVDDTETRLGRKLTAEEKKQVQDLYDEYRKKYINLSAYIDASAQKFSKIGSGLKSVVKNVAKWGLALFGVRSAYMAIRSSLSTISQDDEQLKADIDYMKNALAYVLEPVVRRIVEWAKQLVFYIGYLIKQWTGHDIFASANKNLKKSVGSAKELNKQLAGFDEMQTVGNQNSGSGVGTPSFDLSEINEMSKTGKGLVGIIAAIGGAIAALKLSELLANLGLISEALGFKEGVGIAFIISGLYNLITDLIDLWEQFDETLENNGTTVEDWGKIVSDVGLIVTGIGLAFGLWPVALGGTLILMAGMLMKKWSEIKSWIQTNIIDWIDKQIERFEKTTFGGFVAEILRTVKVKIQEITNILEGFFKSIKQIGDGILLIFKGHVWKGLVSIGKGILNEIISIINNFISILNTLLIPIRSLISTLGQIGGKNWNMGNVKIPQIPYLAKGGIINMPGRGVPVGSAIGGERGQEGVIPLTDSQQMALLGEAIGKYININATVPVYVGNRMVAREIKRINAEDNFAYNR